MKTIGGMLAAAVFGSAVLSAAADASVTYRGEDTQSNVRVEYTITTDGTLGRLLRTNILGSTITFTGLSTGNDNHNFASFTAVNSLYFVTRDDDYNEVDDESPVSANSTDLFFDFGGRGDLNFVTVNCNAIDDCYGSNSAPATMNEAQQSLVYAFAAANTNEFASNVYHNLDRMNVENVKSTKELNDNFSAKVPDYLNSGTYTQVAATRLSFATAVTGAVPEPATWATMMLGFGGMGVVMRRRSKVAARVRPA